MPISVRFSENIKNPDAQPVAPAFAPRKTRLTPEDFKAHGFTVGCQGCEKIQAGSSERRGHTTACRVRMEEALSKSELGQARLQREKDRLDVHTAELNVEDAPVAPKETSEKANAARP